MQRRDFLISMGALVLSLRASSTLAEGAKFEVLELTDAEWKERLSAEAYSILREEGTERAFTSDLLKEKREGMYHCLGCDLPLFPSKFKYESGTGWPSFYDAIEGHLGTSTDYKLVYPRTEYHCAKCGGHHGHVFKDGPEPTGLRYCNNGAVLKFVPKDEAAS